MQRAMLESEGRAKVPLGMPLERMEHKDIMTKIPDTVSGSMGRERRALGWVQASLIEFGAPPQAPPGDDPLDPDAGMNYRLNVETI